MKNLFYSNLPTIFRGPEGGESGGETPPADTATPPADPTTPPMNGETPPVEGETLPGSLINDGETPPVDGEEAGDGETPPAVEPVKVEDIKFPEGVVPDEGPMGEFVDLMNDTEISPTERAQKLIDLQLNIAEEAGKASQALWDKTQTDWQAEALALPEIGGDALPKTLANIKTGLDKLGATKETYAALDYTGAGNHPEIIRILSKATAHLVEGQPLKVDPAPAKGNLSQADRIYGGSKME